MTEPVSIAPQARAASTSSAPSSTPGTESATEVPGIPSTAEPTYPKLNLEIKLPDISQEDPEPAVAIVRSLVLPSAHASPLTRVHALAVRPRPLELL